MTRPDRTSRCIFTFALIVLTVGRAFGISFDNSFGSNGRFMTSFADSGQPSSFGSSIFLQPIGRWAVVGGHFQDTPTGRSGGIALAGLTLFGALDPGFGVGGKLLVWDQDAQRFFTNAVLDSDGSIVVLYKYWQSAANNRPSALRVTQNGQIVQAFTPDLDIVPNETEPVRMALSSSGKLYVLVRSLQYQFFLVRLNPDGSRDMTFGVNGVRDLNLKRFAQPAVTGLRELADGKLLLTGNAYSPFSFEGYTFVVRVDGNMNFDRSFGNQGVVRMEVAGGSLGGVVTELQPDGKILIGGYWTFLGSNAFLARLTHRGRPDATFGVNGIAMTSFNNVNAIRGIALAPDGKISVAGSTSAKAIPSNQRLFVAVFSAAGVRESHLVTDLIAGREAGGSDIFRQPDGKLVVAGFTQILSSTSTQLAAARFTP